MRPGTTLEAQRWSVAGLAVLLLSAACDGGHGSSVRSSLLSGTVSDGSPIASATVTLKDWNGNSRQTTTSPSGRYSFGVRALAPPFLLQADLGGGARFYGIAFDAGTSNVTFFSDRIVGDLGRAIDVPTDDLFADPASSPAPSREAVILLEGLYRDVLACWLRQEGIDPDDFDLLATPFESDGTGFSAILAMTEFVAGSIVIDDGTKSQTSTPVDGPPSWWEMQTSMTSPLGTTRHDLRSYFPASAAGPLAGAISGANAALSALADVVNQRGLALTSDDLLPFITDDCLDDGVGQEILAASVATSLRGVGIADARITRIRTWSGAGDEFDGDFALSTILQGRPRRETVRQRFERSGTGQPFCMAGTGLRAYLAVDSERVTHAYVAGPPDEFDSLSVDVKAPAGSLASVTITSDDSGPIFDATPVAYQGSDVDLLWPTPTTTLEHEYDWYNAFGTPGGLPPPGTHFTFALLPAGSALPEYVTIPMTGATNEPLRLLSPTGHSLADAAFGGRLAVTWELPTTFAVRAIELSGECWDFGGSHRVSISSDELLGPTDRAGHLSFPSDLSGTPISGASFRLAIEGRAGESTVVNWFFGDI